MSDNIIVVSKLSANYENWLKKIDNTVVIIDLYCLDLKEAVAATEEASGLLLTGGSDIHPGRYARNDYLSYCKDIDERRDELELAVIKVAFEKKIPVLGICRGQQILNVAFKGTLIPDIPEFTKSTIPHSGTEDVYHRVNIKNNSQLFKLTEVESEVVNSSHHQAVDTLAKGFTAVAHSSDFIIEAIEVARDTHPFCIGVQWHPERMDFSNPLSWKIGVKFLENASVPSLRGGASRRS